MENSEKRQSHKHYYYVVKVEKRFDSKTELDKFLQTEEAQNMLSDGTQILKGRQMQVVEKTITTVAS